MVMTMPGTQLFRLAFAEARRLVDLQSDTVAGGVREVAVEFGSPQNAARGLVDCAGGRTRLHRCNRRQLRLQHGGVPATLLPAGPADVHGARHVRTIAAQYNTRIHDHKSAARDGLAVARPWGKADLLPAATMVSNDMPSAPAWRAANSRRPATSDSEVPGWMECIAFS